MARMLPPWLGKTTRSGAERLIFGLLRDGLPTDEWTVLHSVDLAVHDRKPWTETDFVLVGPPGVICFEIKGGTLSRKDCIWYSKDRNGREHRLNESPFAQAGGAAAALRRYLSEQARFFTACLCASAVGVPDATFQISGPDVVPEIVFDAGDVDQPITMFVARMVAYWQARLSQITGKKPRPLSANERDRIVGLLGADFELRRSLRAQLRESSDKLLSLTREQGLVLDGMARNERVLVEGGAGTGKTLLALREARRLAKDSRVLFTCFNRNLAEFLRATLGESDRIEVMHFHRLMAKLVREAGLEGRLPDAEESELFEVFYPKLCLEALVNLERTPFGALVVDEGQDLLLSDYLDVLDLLVEGGLQKGRWRIFLDANQSVFGGIAAGGLKQLRQAPAFHYRLTTNCRNTRPIATCTALLSGVGVSDVLRTEGFDVEHTWYSEPQQQRALVSRRVGRLLHQGIAPSDIVILSRYRMERSCVKDGLAAVRFPLVDSKTSPADDDKTIRFATIGAFKGLESDVVLLVDLDDVRRLSKSGALYVATSRARLLLSLFLKEDQRGAYEDLAHSFGTAMAEQDSVAGT